jgi:hypothetical protein
LSSHYESQPPRRTLCGFDATEFSMLLGGIILVTLVGVVLL